ncbi:MAG: DUF2726 domain-containing protein [Gammaproteobacteria bacterium]|nr:DUF2726 domain-containing protein [Gammaproteobacteria bacterium]
MNFLIILAVIAVLAMVIIAAATNKESHRAVTFQRKEKDEAPIKKAKSLLSTNEQMTFIKLRKALPDHFVLSRVALSALLNSSGLVTRNKINRCCVDFVILDKDFNVISIVEINQSTQNSSPAKINERDTMLMEAGYRVIRYPYPPELERIINDFTLFLHPAKTENTTAARSNRLLAENENFFDHDF